MSFMSDKKAEIVFPHVWEYRIFCQSSKCDAVESAIRSMGLNELELGSGAASGSGTYKTLRMTFLAASKDDANAVGDKLKVLDGVRFIL
jgi:putative lipoic acid-binding regulatory protein